MVFGEKPHKNGRPPSLGASLSNHLLPISQEQRLRRRFLNSENVLPHSNEAGTYQNGDVYTPLEQRRPWEINTNFMPYLTHIKNISRGWPSLSYLASWMEVTTSPNKWKYLTEEDRETRAKHTRVAMIDFPKDGEGQPSRTSINSIHELRTLFREDDFSHNPDHSRLFVIEDLSRDVIESFGSAYDIDPHFWRGHISDYLWYNTRDPWIELEELPHITRGRNFYHFRYVHPRYFKNKESQRRAIEEARRMNVLRRLDDDRISASLLDDKQASVNMWRNKASLWVRRNEKHQKHTLAILIVDPSFKEGYPLWGKGFNFDSPPSLASKIIPKTPTPKDSLFEAVVYWTTKMSMHQLKELEEQPNNISIAILSIIAVEWLTVKEYVTTRLTQIEWKLEVPDYRGRGEKYELDASLKWLHPFRRNVPRYRKWVSDILNGILSDRNMSPIDPKDQALRDLREDFLLILKELEMLHAQVQDLVRVVTAIISIEEAKRSAEQNESLGRLTYLAVVFVPLSFVSSFFSMNSDIASLSTTFWIFFAVAVPLTLLSLSVTRWWAISRWFRRGRD